MDKELSELKELIYNLLGAYEGAESSVIWERSGSIDSDIEEMESDIVSWKEEADQLLDRINGRLTTDGLAKAGKWTNK